MPTRRDVIGTAVLAATAGSASMAASGPGAFPGLKFSFEARVAVESRNSVAVKL